MATEILVPPLGTNVDTVTLVKWFAREGDTLAAGDPLFAVETDKATLDVEAPAAGILRGVAASEGDEVPALSRLAWICAAGEDVPDAARSAPRPPIPGEPRGAQDAPRPPIPGETRTFQKPTPPGLEAAPPTRRFASPWARTLAREQGVDWTALAGSGPMGAVVARDVEEAAAGVVETFTLTGIRGKIADRMLRGASETAPVTLTAEVDATAFVALRKAVLAAGLRVSYNDILLMVVARALAAYPRMGATFDGERAVVRRSADIAIAVDTERGLLAPVVRNVQDLTLAQIAVASAGVIERARSGQATADELRGSVFTITNLGMFGIDAFTPIINLPETAILGVGRIRPVPWVIDGQLTVRQSMWLSLTFDHRLLDGGPAARFLQAIVRDIEAPDKEPAE